MSILRIFVLCADIDCMGSLSAFSVIFGVFSDLRLVAACVAVLLYVNFIFYVARYKKKKPVQKKRFIRFKSTEGQQTAFAEKSGTPESTDENTGGSGENSASETNTITDK